jgi:8-oxo-dGTP pyrophosphatase MutT (NUDIX family)
VKAGESYADAAKREAFEELGITKLLAEVGVFYSDERMKPVINMIHYFGLYEVDLSDSEVEALVLEEAEVDALVPMSLQNIAKDMKENRDKYTGGFIRSFNFYIKTKGLDIPYVEF